MQQDHLRPKEATLLYLMKARGTIQAMEKDLDLHDSLGMVFAFWKMLPIWWGGCLDMIGSQRENG